MFRLNEIATDPAWSLPFQFKSTINKIRASKKATNFSADVDFEDSIDALKRRNRADYDSVYDESAGRSSSSIKKSTFKVSIPWLVGLSHFLHNILMHMLILAVN